MASVEGGRNLVVYAMGTYGDVHPMLGLAKELSARGWRIHFLTNGKFRSLVEQLGFQYVEVTGAHIYDQTYNDPETWMGRDDLLHVVRFHVPAVVPAFRAMQRIHVESGVALALGNNRFNGCVFACEDYGIPYVPVNLAPFGNNQLVYAELRARAKSLSGWLRAECFNAKDRLMRYGYFRRIIRKHVNPLRLTLSLPAYRFGDLRDWRDYEMCLALYPEWYAPIGDRGNVVFTNFPCFDPVVEKARARVDGLLATLTKSPIVFVPGSGVKQIEDDVRQAALICESLGREGVFVSRYVAQMGATRVGAVHLVRYVDLAHLLARAALIVHHGGIGTTAQALAAGVPQFIRWMKFDQPDNAARARQLGVARGVSKRTFSMSAGILQMRYLMDAPEVRHRARVIARLVRAKSGLELAGARIHAHALRRWPNAGGRRKD